MYSSPPLRIDETLVLRESERLRLATQVAGIGTFDWDLATGKMIWSEIMEQLHGLIPGSFPGSFEAFLNLVHPADRAAVQRSADASLADDFARWTEFRILSPGCEVKWIGCKSRILRDQRQQPVRCVGVAAEITEWKRSEQRLAAQYAITRVLAESETLAAATPEILRTICESLDWETSAIWMVDQERQVIKCLNRWSRTPDQDSPFGAATRDLHCTRELGLPGRVWASGEPVWVPDLASEKSSIRGHVAELEGLHAAFGFPIRIGQEIVGVMEFFSRNIRQPDLDLLRMFTSIGEQIGQAIERIRAQEALRLSYQVEMELRQRADRARELASNLQSITSELSAALTSEQVADVIITKSMAIMDAQGGVVKLVQDDGASVRSLRSIGYPESMNQRLAIISSDIPLPVTDALRERELVALSTLEEQRARYPYLTDSPGYSDQSVVAVPILWKDRAIGAIALGFAESRRFDDDDRALIWNIAQQCAQALERANLYDAQAAARASIESNLRALEANDAKFRRLIESNVVGVIFGEAEKIVGANQRFLDSVGYSFEDVIAGKLNCREITPPELLPLDDRAVKEVFERGTFTPYEKEYIRKDGSRVPVLFGGASIQLHPVFHWVGFVCDLTELRRLQNQVLRTQKLDSLGAMAGGIAHDFNNLLTGIMGNASLVLESTPPGANHSMLQDVVKASQDAAALTRQMLAYAGRGRMFVGPVDVPKLVHEAHTLLKSAIPKHIKMRVESNGEASIMGDASQIQQLVMNLALNAAESISPQTQGDIVIATGQNEVRREDVLRHVVPPEIRPGLYTVLKVVDNGSGMDEETKSKIFDPFFTTKFTGRGLGLAAVFGIVRGHRGAIQVNSSPGAGTTFTIFLPATSQHFSAS